MSQIFNNLVVAIEDDLDEKLQLLVPNFSGYRIQRKSVDARGKPHFVYTVEVYAQNETPPPANEEQFHLRKIQKFSGSTPLIIGAGPAGLFAALRLVECGIPCKLFEQGADAQTRVQHINQHWRYGKFDSRSNVCFGEGGAGLYSDGKLITRIKSPHIPYVLNRLVKFGAPAEIEYLANPHVGSDRIRRLIPKIRDFLRANGCEILLNTKVIELLNRGNEIYGVKLEDGRIFESEQTILATGHSAEDIFNHLKNIGVFMEGKSFAMGLRVEHPQKLINKIQYREYAENIKLGAANYRLAHHDHKTGVGVYSFCMCPGGYVISSTSDDNTVVCNGMSNFNRNGPFANSAIVVSLDHQTHFGKDTFGGLTYRRDLETKAFAAVKRSKALPVQNTIDFIKGKNSIATKTSSPSGVIATRLDQLLPAFIREKIIEGLEKFETLMPGFLSNESQLHGVESRTSCPIRITRDKETLQSLSHRGLYPVGEGAGYAGGITSAAVDGIRAAEAIIDKFV